MRRRISNLLQVTKSRFFAALRMTILKVGFVLSQQSHDALVRALTYDVALYRIDARNDIIPYRGGRFYFTAGKTRRLGAELNGNIGLRYGLSAQIAASFSRNKYLEYVVDSVHYGNPGKIAAFSDNRMAGLPDYYYKATVKYAPPLLHGLSAQVGWQGVGKYYADDANTYAVPSYTVFDAAIGVNDLKLGKSKFIVSGFVGINNIADKHYASSAYINPDLDQMKKYPIYLEPGLPRNWVASVSLKWMP